ncbi:MAG TPA: type I-U CRISPR-associated protein Csb2 [Chloroflexota bacterium]|nr:type I-U CRISPR-associated protein Csb2 [Chloroflexota bacterium]
MTTFVFTFPTGQYHATPWGHHANEAAVAWPPEPVRILRALIATWWRKMDHTRYPKVILDELVGELASDVPEYCLPPAVHTHVRAFMPTPSERKLVFDGFLRLEDGQEVVVLWRNVSLSPKTRELASLLLENLGYLGRAESWAEGRLAADVKVEVNSRPRRTGAADVRGEPADVAVPLTPAEWEERRKELESRSRPLPQSLADALAVDTSDWQRAGWSSPPPIRLLSYDRPATGPLPPALSSRRKASRCRPGRPEAARFVVAGLPLPSVEQTLQIAEIMRAALMRDDKNSGARPPVEISGRDDSGPLRDDPAHSHAFYLPEDADGDGRIDHILVYARLGFSHEARRRLNSRSRLWPGRGKRGEGGAHEASEWRIALEAIAAPERFADASELVKKAATWESVTPYLKPRFDRRPGASFGEVVETYRVQISSEWARRFPGCPAPLVEPLIASGRFYAPVGPGGMLKSTLAFRRTRAGRGGPQPDATGGFFRLTFAEPVQGPLVLGWGAHFGMGQFRARP